TGVDAVFGKHQQRTRFARLFETHEAVFEFWMDIQRLVGGNGPGRCRPNDHRTRVRRRLPEYFGHACWVVERKRYIDGGVTTVGILDFRFSQGRATIETPVHRLQATEDKA